MSDNKRLLVVTPFFPDFEEDGHGIAWRQSATALAAEGFEVTVLVLKSWRPNRQGPRLARSQFDSALRIAHPSLHVVRRRYPGIPGHRLPEVSFALLKLVAGLHILLHLRRPHDAVLVHTDRLGFAAEKALRRHACVRLLRLHAFDVTPQVMRTHHRGTRTPRMFKSFDRVLAVGSPVRRKLVEMYGNLPAITVVPQGIEVSSLPSPVPRPRAGLRIVSASVLFEGKGIQDSLCALALLRDGGYIGWQFAIYGEGPYRPHLIELIRQLELTDYVSLHGWLPHDDLVDRMAKADIFLLPSHHEAFGVAHLEAMALGCVVIGPQGEGPSDFIRHGETGFLVEPGRAGEIAAVLRELVDDPALLAAVAQEATRSARVDHTWRQFAHAVTAMTASTSD